jgi:hypothetical protein
LVFRDDNLADSRYSPASYLLQLGVVQAVLVLIHVRRDGLDLALGVDLVHGFAPSGLGDHGPLSLSHGATFGYFVTLAIAVLQSSVNVTPPHARPQEKGRLLLLGGEALPQGIHQVDDGRSSLRSALRRVMTSVGKVLQGNSG